MKKRFPAIITMLLVLVSLLALLSGCGQAWTCDECGKEFFGTVKEYIKSKLSDSFLGGGQND